MATSKTSIGNRALSKLGQPRVSNVDTEDVKAARVIREMWDHVRDAMLQSYSWNFAVKRATLAPADGEPEWGWDYHYTLPVDCLAIIEIKDDPDYTVENGKILTDEGDALYIRYIYKVTDVTKFSPLFCEALATQLAYEACEELTQSNTKKNILFSELSIIIDRAFSADAIENPAQAIPESDWITARV